jgi:hypothetical protein
MRPPQLTDPGLFHFRAKPAMSPIGTFRISPVQPSTSALEANADMNDTPGTSVAGAPFFANDPKGVALI